MREEEQLLLEGRSEPHPSNACVKARGRSSSGLCGARASEHLARKLAAAAAASLAASAADAEEPEEAAEGTGKRASSSSASARARGDSVGLARVARPTTSRPSPTNSFGGRYSATS